MYFIKDDSQAIVLASRVLLQSVARTAPRQTSRIPEVCGGDKKSLNPKALLAERP